MDVLTTFGAPSSTAAYTHTAAAPDHPASPVAANPARTTAPHREPAPQPISAQLVDAPSPTPAEELADVKNLPADLAYAPAPTPRDAPRASQIDMRA